MQTIPVDLSRLGACTCVVPPEPKVINHETGEVKTDRDGATVYVGVAVRGTGRRASIIEVAVSGEPKGVTEGARVQITDLEAYSWAMGDRHGLSFRAAAIAPAAGTPGGKGGDR